MNESKPTSGWNEAKVYIVALWHEDPRYTVFNDAVGGKVYKRESTAEKHADHINAETNYGKHLSPDSRGFVVRSVSL